MTDLADALLFFTAVLAFLAVIVTALVAFTALRFYLQDRRSEVAPLHLVEPVADVVSLESVRARRAERWGGGAA